MNPMLVMGVVLAICILMLFLACLHSDEQTTDSNFEEYRRLNKQAQLQRYHQQHAH